MTEPTTKTLQALAEKGPTMIVWWAAEVECASAIARLEREAALDEAAVSQAFERLKHLAHAWHEVDPSDPVREAAVRFLRVHPLRAADALQLAAAFIAAERRPSSLEAVTLDERLAVAGAKRGIRIDRGVIDRRAVRSPSRQCRGLTDAQRLDHSETSRPYLLVTVPAAGTFMAPA
jgi:hypothetical protein